MVLVEWRRKVRGQCVWIACGFWCGRGGFAGGGRVGGEGGGVVGELLGALVAEAGEFCVDAALDFELGVLGAGAVCLRDCEFGVVGCGREGSLTSGFC